MLHILDVSTGELTRREMTPEELAQDAANQSAAAAAQAERDASEVARLASKESARAKLAALGLTEEEIAALVG